MARIKLPLPKTFPFQTEIPIRIGDINYGGHLGNDSVLTIVHEARMRFLQSMGYSEANIEGHSILMTDAVVVYRSEGFYGDILTVDVAVADMTAIGCDIIYRLINAASGKEVARAKTGIIFADPATKKIAAIPEGFRARFA